MNYTNRMKLGKLNDEQRAELQHIDDEMMGKKDQAEITDAENEDEERLLNGDPEN